MRLRVGIDARLAAWPGIGRYIHLLLEGLKAVEGVEVVAYATTGQSDDLPKGVDYRVFPARPFTVAEQLRWPVAIARERLHVFHAPHFVFPVLTQTPVVVTVHDAAPLRFPPSGLAALPRRSYTRFFHVAAARRASAVITDSAFARREILELLHVPANRVHVVSIALDPVLPELARHPDVSSRRDALGARMPYVLYVGTNKPWKNLEVALRGADLAARSVNGLELVLAGKQAQHQESLVALQQRVAAAVPVHVLDVVQDADLAPLYGGALAVLCPSVYEGFGLTALEALACGAPVIHSGAASLPEVVGDVGLTADPHEPRAWAHAIERLAADSGLRTRLAIEGPRRANAFAVDRMAQETVEVYRHAAAKDVLREAS